MSAPELDADLVRLREAFERAGCIAEGFLTDSSLRPNMWSQ